MSITRTTSIVFLSLALTGCIGEIGPGEDDDGGGPESAAAAGTAPTDLRRLSAYELRETLRDLVGEQALAAAALPLGAVPADRSAPSAFASLPYSSEARGVTSSHVDAHYEVFVAIAEYFRDNPAATTALASCLPAGASDSACVSVLVADFGERVYRRPLTDGERAAALESHAAGLAISPDEAIAAVLLRLFLAPPFLYRLEIAGPEESDNVYQLDEFEIASRLSYLAWGTLPDEALFDQARAGALHGDVLEAEITRLFADPRATRRAQAFFEEWLSLDHLAPVDQPASFLAGIDPALLDVESREEMASFVGGLYDNGGTYSDLMLSNGASLGGDAIASVYGVEANATTLPAERAGILTRSAFLRGPGVSTHPIRRGAAIQRYLLCNDIAPPDPSQFPPNSIVPPPFSADKSARERWTEQTSAANCASCHSYINAPGFALEPFDSLGRYRETEPIIDPQSGEVVNELPIDSGVEMTLFGETVQIADARALAEALAESDEARRCFVTQAFRFTEGRRPAAEDAAFIADATAIVGDTGIKAALEQIARAPSFQLKKVMP
jgi:mono/diheme cytochrome c family protein